MANLKEEFQRLTAKPLSEWSIADRNQWYLATSPENILELLSECSRLASRVEELEKVAREASAKLAKYGWWHGISWNTVREIISELDNALAGAHAEGKGL